MTSDPRVVVEGVQLQGSAESISWTIDVSLLGTSPTVSSVVAYDEDGTDVSLAVLTGSATIPTSTTILLPTLHSLTEGKEYQVYTNITIDGNDLTIIIPFEVGG